MATPRPTAGLPPPALAPPGLAQRRRVARWWPAVALAVVVVGWHAWLVALLAPAAPRAGAPRAGLEPMVVQWRSLPQVVAMPLPLADAPAAPPLAALAATRPAPGASARRARWPAATPPAPALPEPVVPAPDSAVRASTSTHLPTDPPTAPSTSASTDAGDAADAGAVARGEPPPLYPTRLPPPVQLRYALRYNGHAGEALLVWQHDGQRYRLTLDGLGAGGAPLLAQASTGALGAHGLAPQRFVDRRRGGRQQAANFRDDSGRIAYSGQPHTHPAWPGAQDRLSWLAQLAAILAAAEHNHDRLQLFVADARGNASLWQLQQLPGESGPTPWGTAALQRWQREPPRPEGLRIDVWLAATPGATPGAPPGTPPGAPPGTPAGHWPLRLRFEVPRSGDVFELQLLAVP